MTSGSRMPMDIAELRARLEQERGARYWRSLEQIAGTPEYQELVQREFGPLGMAASDGVSRRGFLSLVGASLALAGLTGCDEPPEYIVPHVRRPEERLPGSPSYFATAMPLRGDAIGVLAKSHMGRPINLEGNEKHASSGGAIDSITQASILGLYDPDRSQVVRHLGQIATWDGFAAALRKAAEAAALNEGRGLHVLSEPIVSPTLADQRRRLLARFPKARWHQYTPVHRDHQRAGHRMAFGRDVAVRYDLGKADVVLSLDSDFLHAGPGHLRYARQFARRRREGAHGGSMNRLYAVECTPTVTGAAADHRFALTPQEAGQLARALARRVTGSDGVAGDEAFPWLQAVAEDLLERRGRALVLVGRHQPPEVHALGHVINEALGAFGHTVKFSAPVEAVPEDQCESIRALATAMRGKEIETLLIAGGNPVYDAPADLGFADALEHVPTRIHLGLYEDETARHCHWHVPEAHALESWSDTRAHDGTVSVIQPLIAPLYGGKTVHEVLGVLLDDAGQSGSAPVRAVHEKRFSGANFDGYWRKTLHDGVMPDTALPEIQPSVSADVGGLIATAADVKDEGKESGLCLVIRPDPTIWDGRFANNGWLQELPKPLTKLTWDDAALISPKLAEKHALANGDVVELRFRDRAARGPVWIVPGHPDGSVTVHLGHGRTRAGRVGSGIGFDVNPLRPVDAPWGGSGLEMRKTGERHRLACTQDHHAMEGRHHVRAGTVQRFDEHPEFVREIGHEPHPGLSLYPTQDQAENAWGMAIDLNTCIGCNACVTACQAENNIPIVGPDEVRNGREMHWIRVDRYYGGKLDDPETYFQPVPCMHCEDAPCEVVCPVSATVHSDEGLNDMVYNRCVGTRYCSNNCPYKVRRFNFYEYADFETPSLKLLNNPDVTVRSRGVMEKCTYCVQRINGARIDAKKKGVSLEDGDVVTACQAACPTQAIVFGDINDSNSEVSRRKREPLNYALLGELNTRPRTTYLAKLSNPNPKIPEEPSHG